jgi:hypothetical protein
MGCGGSTKNCKEPERVDLDLKKSPSNPYIAESDSQPKPNSKEVVVSESDNLQLQSSPTKSIISIITKA